MGGGIPLVEAMPVVAHPITSDRAGGPTMGPSAGLHLCALSIMLAIAFADDVGTGLRRPSAPGRARGNRNSKSRRRRPRAHVTRAWEPADAGPLDVVAESRGVRRDPPAVRERWVVADASCTEITTHISAKTENDGDPAPANNHQSPPALTDRSPTNRVPIVASFMRSSSARRVAGLGVR